MPPVETALRELLDQALAGEGFIVALTGAGISAESGIPTFRGKEGYWTVGSSIYRPQEMATRAAFGRMPRDVWGWYLYRRTVCRRAEPNAAHRALADLERALGDRFRLLTQNVDGLHLRAGSSRERTYQIHGNIDYLRCFDECSATLTEVPDEVGAIDRGDEVGDDLLELLRCSACGGPGRPHVLWFDECYDEPLFRFESSIRAAAEASLLLTIGTSGATNLPNQVVQLAASRGAAVVDINPEDNPFGELAAKLERGYAARGTATQRISEIVEALTAR